MNTPPYQSEPIEPGKWYLSRSFSTGSKMHVGTEFKPINIGSQNMRLAGPFPNEAAAHHCADEHPEYGDTDIWQASSG